jgi:hypothetical protein
MIPPVTHVPRSFFPLVIAVIGAAAAIAGTTVMTFRKLRGRLLDPSRVGGTGVLHGTGTSHSGALDGSATGPRSEGVVRALAERGLVDGPQLASMTAAEREFFLTTVTAKLGDGVKPRLMTQTRTVGTATGAAIAVLPDVTDEPIPHAALVSGAIHCPVCRTPIGKRTDAPLLMSRCPGCSRRVAAHIDGDRLTVTLHYTLRTPAMGVVTIKS